MSLIYGAVPYVSPAYTNDPVGQAVSNQISQNMAAAFQMFAANLASAINQAALPYENDKCMLCKQRDCDVVPDFVKY